MKLTWKDSDEIAWALLDKFPDQDPLKLSFPKLHKMVLELEAIGPHLESVAEEWSRGVDHGAMWPAKIFAAKYRAVEGSWRVVDLGLDVTGGTGIFRSAGYERLIRDARLGRIHPANSFLTHEVVAKTALGISLDEQPRWG